MPKRVAKQNPRSIRTWISKLRAALDTRGCGVPKSHTDLLTKLAALVEIAEGSERVYWTLVDLFGHPKRRSRWSEALEEIPPEKKALARLSECKRAYDNLALPKSKEPIHKAHINLTQVIEVMLQIPNPEAYVRETIEGGLERVGTIFHPNTLERAKQTLRGDFGYGQESDHTDELLRRLDLD